VLECREAIERRLLERFAHVSSDANLIDELIRQWRVEAAKEVLRK
jgi:hypothetical protein